MVKRNPLRKEQQIQGLESIIHCLNLLLDDVKSERTTILAGKSGLESYAPFIGLPSVTLDVSVTWMAYEDDA